MEDAITVVFFCDHDLYSCARQTLLIQICFTKQEEKFLNQVAN